MQPVLVLNGPNLHRLGSREPEIYGHDTFADLVHLCRDRGEALGLEVDVRQTDVEAQMLGWLHEAADRSIPVVLNPAAWTHTSVALRDACAMLTAPFIEVHLSNPARREEFRHRSMVSDLARGVIAGFGIGSYALALEAVANDAGSRGPSVAN